MVRELIGPLFPVLVLLVYLVIILWRRRALNGWERTIGVGVVGVLWSFSTPYGAWLLEKPLIVESKTDGSDTWSPTYIYVLSAGFEIGDRAEHDFSGFETMRRVNRAVDLWREHPSAIVIMAGTPPEAHGRRERWQQGRLMQLQAERLGVPAGRIRLETISTNTAGHARVASQSTFLSRDTPLAIVTSDFHLRRARKEFTRYFDDVTMIGSDPVSTRGRPPLSLGALTPRVDALGASTLYVREYVALALSDLRNWRSSG